MKLKYYLIGAGASLLLLGCDQETRNGQLAPEPSLPAPAKPMDDANKPGATNSTPSTTPVKPAEPAPTPAPTPAPEHPPQTPSTNSVPTPEPK